MDFALVAGTLLLGLAGTPHCAAMCAAPCTLAVGRGGARAAWAFHVARIASYAGAGALAASSVNALGALSETAAVLRPLWTLLHLAALALGVWLLVKGRQPAWLDAIGTPLPRADGGGGWRPVAAGGPPPAAAARPAAAPLRAAAAGALWVAWPCGLLQSAIVVAALADGAAVGAAAMAAFGAATAAGVAGAPWLWRRVGRGGGPAGGSGGWVRAAGALLAVASAWAIGQRFAPQVAAWCGV